MLKKRYSIVVLFILLVGIFSISIASASDNGTDDTLIANNFESEALEMSFDDDFDNLQDLIDASDIGDTIELNQDYQSYGSDIQIYNPITIDGKGHTLDGDNSSGILYIDSDNVVVKNIIFKNGFSDVDGGAIICYGNNCIVINCTFISNSATSDGGAVYLHGDNASIIDSTFNNNSADLGGAVFSSSTGGKIVNCNFIKNNAFNGGAVDWQGSDSTIMDCNFTDNVGTYGGAVIWYGENGLLTNCNFKNNSATSDGGAIFWGGENGTISQSSFQKNKAKNGKNFKYCNGTKLLGLKDYDKATLKLSVSGNYYKNSVLSVKLLYSDETGVPNTKIKLKFSNGKEVCVTTNSKGAATYSIPYVPNTYSVKATVEDGDVSANAATLNNIKIKKAPAKLTPTKLSTSYSSGKYFQIKVVNTKTKEPISGVKLKLKVYTGKKYKTVSVTTNSKGIAKYSASKLSIGTHKVIVQNANTKYFTASSKTSSIKITKAALKITAPKVNNGHKMAGTFKVTVKNKESGAAMKNVKVTVKVYTGSKYKTYNLKTNAKGQVSISTKALSKAKHKVVINVKSTAKYKASKANSLITITKKKINTTLSVSMGNQYFNDFGDFNGANFKVTLKDTSGKYLTKKIHYNFSSRIYWGSETTEYTGTLMSNEYTYVSIEPGSIYRNSAFAYLDFEFKGDSTYAPSKCRVKLMGP